jgi:hypothetical protein
MAPNYTQDELYLIASLPHTIGAAMAFVGHSGLFDTGKEMFVSATSILNGVKEYPTNALIQRSCRTYRRTARKQWAR